jgi:hypothetical protein
LVIVKARRQQGDRNVNPPVERCVKVALIDQAYAALVDMTVLQGFTETDTMNRAIQIYAYLMRKQEQGADILIRDSGGSIEKVDFR